MSTFSGLMGPKDQAPFWFPWAYHGTATINIPAIYKRGLLPLADYYSSHAMLRTGRPALFFSAVPVFAAGYARVFNGVLLRFSWPEDARMWMNEKDKQSILRSYNELRKLGMPSSYKARYNWLKENQFSETNKTGIVLEDDRGVPEYWEYVSEKPVQSSKIQVFAGTITENMTRGLSPVEDSRFNKWVPLERYYKRLREHINKFKY